MKFSILRNNDKKSIFFIFVLEFYKNGDSLKVYRNSGTKNGNVVYLEDGNNVGNMQNNTQEER